MKKSVALPLCFLLLGCTIGVNLKTPEGTVGTWLRSFNDRDVEGMYLTLSKEYIFAHGGEEHTKAEIRAMLEEAKKQEIKYRVKGIGVLVTSEGDPVAGENIYLANLDKEYVEDNEKKVEEILLNFKVLKEDGKYKIEEFWD
jgi:hypothetical protein